MAPKKKKGKKKKSTAPKVPKEGAEEVVEEKIPDMETGYINLRVSANNF
jgi:hypothetical protein